MRQPLDLPDLRLPGTDLTELVSGAEHEIVLAAPFIKASVLASVLTHARAVPITCITRWQPEEVAAGVSDLEVFDVLASEQEQRFSCGHLCMPSTSGLTGNAS